MIDCSFASASVVFRGRVDFNNDDGSGTFIQQTLIRFKVAEIFKGLPVGTDHVWVDPGSFTSCYAEYRWGKEYLVFPYGGATMPGGTAAMTIAPGSKSSKPLPEEFRSPHPPVVYFAPECTGTRETGYPDFNNDIAAVRRYARGASVAPIVGQVLLSPHAPWSGKGRLAGAEVLLHAPDGVWRTTTNSEGKFFFDRRLPDGTYDVMAAYPGTAMQHSSLHVYPPKCSYVFLSLPSTHSITGIVVNAAGRAVRGITVGALLASDEESDRAAFTSAKTDAAGRFQLNGIPMEPVKIAAFRESPDSGAVPDPAIYYPDVITVDVRKSDSRIEISIPERPARKWVNIEVKFSDGAPARDANVEIRDANGGRVGAKTNGRGFARILLIEHVTYTVQAWKPIDSSKRELQHMHHLLSKKTPFTLGASDFLTLVLDHVRRYWDDSEWIT
jgi:hypothetical protein